MRVTRLYLRNFRVYEQPVELELPAGLVGVYGPNGAGKSALLESLLWTLWGKARTSKDLIRTSGVNAECVTEVEFEHEGHLYVVRRSIQGQSSTVRAEAHADGTQVAEGARDTGRYVHSVLGMDDVAFRSSVFAEQGQVAAFSSNAPAERRRLVLALLGVTPLDSARDRARADAREARGRLEQLRASLADSGELQEKVALAEAAAEQAAKLSAEQAGEEARAAGALEEVEAAHDALSRRGILYGQLVNEGKAKVSEAAGANERAARLAGELEGLRAAEARLGELSPLAEGLAEAEELARLSGEEDSARRALEGLPVGPEPPRPDESALERSSGRASELSRSLAEVEGYLRVATEARGAAAESLERAADLSGGEDCPLCGQSLGDAFGQVQAHRRHDLAEAEAKLGELGQRRAELASSAASAAEERDSVRRALEAERAAWAEHQSLAAVRSQAEQRVRAAAETLQRFVGAGVQVPALEAVVDDLGRRRQAHEEAAGLKARLERRSQVEADLASEHRAALEAEQEAARLREEVRELGYSAEELTRSEKARDEARAAHRQAAAEARRAEKEASSTASALAAERGRLEEALRQAERLEAMSEDVRHTARTAEVLSAFRNSVVGAIGPRLSAQAAELFGELTDHEYDRLEVDPDTYEVQVRDQGVLYGMDRFSGSETDLANLALRVAISEQVRFQSGGAVGLLVLDEVFGPLDDDRRERMLGALERLRGRFRQVVVVTHSGEVKEQLPNAVEVVKLPGRRATVRVL